ncbi:MAG: protein kinase domain-containing protein [Planctomycetota bacterium]
MSTLPSGFGAAKDRSESSSPLDSWRKEFVRRWRAEQSPRIEEYLEKVSDGDAERVLRALLELELKLRLQDKQSPRVSDYVTRFPAHEAAVREVFSLLKQRLAGTGDDRPGAATVTASFDQSHPTTKQLLADAGEEPVPERIDRFEIVAVLGRGGFGTVYRARDPKLNRDVAIKVPRLSRQGEEEEAARLLREARSAATLSHPNICPIFEIGQQAGQPFIVMALIEGRPLSQFIAGQADISPHQAATVIHKLARALGEAHAKGVIHRDIKPANIMIDRRGQPIVMDFGLARRVSAGDPSLTREGVIVGTPAYMSPEQARGDTPAVGPASDVFALGVVLYELLTGRRAFVGALAEVIEQILGTDPQRPSEIRADVDPALEAICLKALSKDPARRYRSMKAFAEDLSKYLAAQRSAAGATTSADDEAVTQKFAAMLKAISAETAESRRWRRNWIPIVASLVGATIVGVILLLGIVLFGPTPTATVMINIDLDVRDPSLDFFLDGEQISGEILTKPIELKVGRHELIVKKDQRLFRRYTFEVTSEGAPVILLAEQERKLADAAPPETATEPIRPPPQAEPPSAPLAPPQLQASEHEKGPLPEGVRFTNLLPSRSARVMGDGRFSIWGTGGVKNVAFDAEGKRLVVMTSQYSLAHAWDATSGVLLGLVKGIGLPKALSQSGRLAVSQESDTLLVWRVDTGETVLRISDRPEACAAISPDDRQVLAAYADGRMEVIALDADKRVQVVRKGGPAGAAVVYSPSGRLAAMIDRRGGQWLFDTTTWQVRHKLSDTSDVPGEARRIAFSDQQNRIAFAGPTSIEIWDTSNGRRIAQTALSDCEGIAISPDGRLLAVGLKSTISLYSVDQGALLGKVQSRTDSPVILCFSPDGRQLAGAGHRSTMVCDPYRRRVLAEPTICQFVTSVRFSSDGLILFAGAKGIYAWQLAKDRWLKLPGVDSTIQFLAVCADDSRLLYLSYGWVVNYDLRTERELDRLSIGGNVTQAAASEDGTLVSAVTDNRRIVNWNLGTRAMVCAPWTMDAEVRHISLNASGSRLAVTTADGMVTVFDTASGAQTHAFDRGKNASRPVALSRDGRILAAGGERGVVLRWNLETGDPLPAIGSAALILALSADAGRIALLDNSERLRIFDAITGMQTHNIVLGPDVPWLLSCSMDFSPDGQYIAVGNANGTVYLFSLTEQQSVPESGPGTGQDAVSLKPATQETRPTENGQ